MLQHYIRLVIILFCTTSPPLSAQTIWGGPKTTFKKADFADWTLEANQDRLTDSVWLTRADMRGIFNIAQEEIFDKDNPIGPADTEWAVGRIADGIENLTFTTWSATNPNGPNEEIGVEKVLHLITDDIYLDIKFTEWTQGGGGSGTGMGGGFTYERSTPGTSSPVITVRTELSAPFLDLTAEGPSAISADLNDLTDPAKSIGISFTISDPDTPIDVLAVSASSSNQTVIADADLVISGMGSERKLTMNPRGAGIATVSLNVTDPDGGSDIYIFNYAVSDATEGPSTIFHAGSSDASTASVVDAEYMWVGDDENQTIRLYDRNHSGMPIRGIDFNADLGSGAEIEIEGSYRKGGRIYWIGSHRTAGHSVIFRTVESGVGINATLRYDGNYTSLHSDLMTWDNANIHEMGAGFLGLSNGFEIEGMTLDPFQAGSTLLTFRGPVIDGKALIVPVVNLESVVSTEVISNHAVLGKPVFLNLGGRSIRSIECGDNGCLIIAGPVGTVRDYRLFTWTGNPADQPEMRGADLSSLAARGSIEGIIGLPEAPFLGAAGNDLKISLLLDAGTFDFYGNGMEAKDLPHPQWKKSRSEVVTLGAVETLPIFNNGDVVITEIMRNPNAVADGQGEWFEIYNASSVSINLNGWGISDADSDQHIIESDASLEIPPGAFWVLGSNADVATNGGVAINYQYSGIELSEEDDELILIASDGTEIDRVAWDAGTIFPNPSGASMALMAVTDDNSDGANWCMASTPYGDGDAGTPGMVNDCPEAPAAILRVTEIWAGQEGADLTADWFEINNNGPEAWVRGADPELYYDDESQDASTADLIRGIERIEPGATAIVLVTGDTNDIATFRGVWSPVTDLTDVAIGYVDGAGLDGGGDAVTLWMGDPNRFVAIDVAAYPATDQNDGQSYDVELDSFSVVGNANGAVATLALGGDNGEVVNVGSPGNRGPIVGIETLFNASIELEVFPNPTADAVRVRLKGEEKHYLGRMTAPDGTVVQRFQINGVSAFQIDLQSLPAGVYNLHMWGERGSVSKLIVKK